MRSTEPQPGNPWPHDMLLTIEDTPQVLHELLWVREAWGLDLAGPDLPPPLTDTPRLLDQELPGSRDEWRYYWPEFWEAGVAHAAAPHDSAAFERLTASEPGSDERREVLERLRGPSWSDRFGVAAFPAAHGEWMRAQHERHAGRRPQTLEETPERRSLAALVPAWEAGLEKVVAIPCRGAFTRRAGASTLLLTEETRDDPARYAEALQSFR